MGKILEKMKNYKKKISIKQQNLRTVTMTF